MFNSCQIICEKCKKTTTYIRKVRNFCSSCNKEIILEKEIENLVVSLNHTGIVTKASCAGHKNGFDSNKRPYPCVFPNDPQSCEKAERMIKKYNSNCERDNQWIVWEERLMIETESLIRPIRKERNLEKLQKEANKLAAYISGGAK